MGAGGTRMYLVPDQEGPSRCSELDDSKVDWGDGVVVL